MDQPQEVRGALRNGLGSTLLGVTTFRSSDGFLVPAACHTCPTAREMVGAAKNRHHGCRPPRFRIGLRRRANSFEAQVSTRLGESSSPSKALTRGGSPLRRPGDSYVSQRRTASAARWTAFKSSRLYCMTAGSWEQSSGERPNWGHASSPGAPDRSWDDRPHAAVAVGSTPSISSGCPAAATRQGSPTTARSGTPRRSRSPPSAMPRTGWPPSGLAWCAAPGVHPNSARSPWPATPPACSRSGHLHVQRQHRGVTRDRRTRLGFALSGCRRSRPRRARC